MVPYSSKYVMQETERFKNSYGWTHVVLSISLKGESEFSFTGTSNEFLLDGCI